MSINITVEGGSSKRLLTGGKYCDQDIVVTAEGGGNEINTGTCTVEIIPPSSSNYYVGRETVASDGSISYAMSRSYTGGKISVTTRCDSVMYIMASTIKGATVTDGEILKLASGYGVAFKTPVTNNTTTQVTLTA